MSHIVHQDYVRKFIADSGRPFNVYYVVKGAPTFCVSGGDSYPACDDIVEFYDATYVDIDASGHPLGQFTGGGYYASTLLDSAIADLDRPKKEVRTGPFRLNGGVPSWDIDRYTWLDIVAWIAEHGTPTADKARLIEGWPVRSVLHSTKHSARHGETYACASEFHGYTSSNGTPCGWYAKEGTADCGHRYNNLGIGHAGMGTGYALKALLDPRIGDSVTQCYGCAHRDHLARLDGLKAGKGKIVGYVSTDGTLLTTWDGYPLAEVVSHRVNRNNMGVVEHWVFRRGTRTFYGTNGGAGLSVYVGRHARRPSYIPAGVSPVFAAVDIDGVAL